MTRGRQQLRLGGSSRRALGLLALVSGFYLVGRASGAGWVVVLLCALAASVVVGTVWPLITLLRVHVEVVDSPSDATAGSAVRFSVRVSRAGPGVRLRLRGAGVQCEWMGAVGTCQGEMIVTPTRRGIVAQVEGELAGAGPLGLVTWSRRQVVALPRAMEVGPAPAAVSLDEAVGIGPRAAEAILPGGTGHETMRGLRPYAVGDPVRIVHWPATARWGEVIVKELEDPAARELVIVVDLQGEPDRAEAAASLAAGLAGAGLRSGLPVSLLTAERSGPRAGSVVSAVQVGRRLARAVATAPPPEPVGTRATVIRVAAE